MVVFLFRFILRNHPSTVGIHFSMPPFMLTSIIYFDTKKREKEITIINRVAFGTCQSQVSNRKRQLPSVRLIFPLCFPREKKNEKTAVWMGAVPESLDSRKLYNYAAAVKFNPSMVPHHNVYVYILWACLCVSTHLDSESSHPVESLNSKKGRKTFFKKFIYT